MGWKHRQENKATSGKRLAKLRNSSLESLDFRLDRGNLDCLRTLYCTLVFKNEMWRFMFM